MQHNFNQVIFSDECCFQLRRCNKSGKHFVYRLKTERFAKCCIKQSRAVEEQGSVTLRGCVSSTGFGILQIMNNQTMNSERYIETLENYLIPSCHLLFPDVDFEFQHDNAAPHTARIVRDWIQGNNISFTMTTLLPGH